jgi:SAM-dependent methyltransferase
MDPEATFIAKRARSFGAVAELYDQARPSYPAELFAHVAGLLPGPRVLEVGAGTGKATVDLIALNLEVTCVEPDPFMAAVLADRTAGRPPARIEVETFESFEATGAYDAIFSAQAWHWTDRASRMDRAAALLRPGGVLGLVWNIAAVIQEELYDAIQRIYTDFGLFGRDRPRDPVGKAAELAVIQDPNTWPGNEIAAHAGFEYLGTSRFPWRQDYTAAEFGAFQESTSHYQVLDPAVRGRLLAAVTTLIGERFEDRISLEWSAQCYDARRLG